jgi:hypothetical protein
LGLTAAGRLAGQPEASAAMVPPGWAPVAHAGAETQTYGVASWTSSLANGSNGAVEYGFRA